MGKAAASGRMAREGGNGKVKLAVGIKPVYGFFKRRRDGR